MSDECLEVFNVHSLNTNPIEMRLNKNKAIIDPMPLFNAAFNYRDSILGLPAYPRLEDSNHTAVYRFDLVELVEAFCGGFSPEQLAGYFKAHFPADDEYAETFMKQIRDVPKNMDVLRLVWFKRNNAPWNSHGSCYLHPIYGNVQNICDYLGRRSNKKFRFVEADDQCHFSRIVPGFRRENPSYDKTPQKIKSYFAGRETPVAVTFFPRLMPDKLTDVHVAAYYDLNLEGLQLVRTNVKKT